MSERQPPHPMAAQVDDWFTYHAPTPGQQHALQDLREGARIFAHMMLTLVPAGADRTVALRKLRESVMTANAAIVLEGR